ncbi:MAG: two component system sensor kinase [Rhodoglobus sp.]|nr:two component system sensor kinase [Rhodoglobus sp.]
MARATQGGQYCRVSLPRRERRSIVIGWAIVAAIVVAIASLVVSATLSTTIYGVPVAAAFPIAALQALAVPLALLRPTIAAGATVSAVIALALVQTGGGHAPWPWAVPTIITHAIVIGLLGVQARPRLGLAAWAAAIAGTVVIGFVHPRGTDETAVNIIVTASVSGVALAAGTVLREWRSIRGQLIRERAVSFDEHERRILAEEKTRIARELHDVVAHSMSIINVQATSAVYRHHDVSPPVAREFDQIAAAARGAIYELRGLLAVLREEGVTQQLTPQPGLADIPALVLATERSGIEIEYRRTGDPDLHVGHAVGLAAYRIVQEALSNAIRHAPRSAITVTCDCDENGLTVKIVNAPPDLLSTFDSAGHGVVGMRERAAAAGGTIEIGPTPEGGFAVTARLPLRHENDE